MSRLFILFLIALLPLRGWSVERMAVQMEGRAMHAQTLDAGMSVECALHMRMDMPMAAAADSEQDSQGADHAPDHKGCQSCQLCMPLAALGGCASLQAATAPQALPVSCSKRFVSADPERNAKPPIS